MAGCPTVDIDSNICELNGQEVACNLIRECDYLTGAQHFEYALPYGNTNANIWVIGADGVWRFNGPDEPNVPPPTLPPDPQVTYAPIEHQIQPIYTAVVTPTAISSPTPIATPELAPPSGAPTFSTPPAVINPTLGPAPQYWTGGAPADPADDRSSEKKPSDAGGITWLDDLTGGTLSKEIGQTGIPLWVLLVAAAATGYMLYGGKR
jgi:hypothetical protein